MSHLLAQGKKAKTLKTNTDLKECMGTNISRALYYRVRCYPTRSFQNSNKASPFHLRLLTSTLNEIFVVVKPKLPCTQTGHSSFENTEDAPENPESREWSWKRFPAGPERCQPETRPAREEVPPGQGDAPSPSCSSAWPTQL